MLIEAPPALSTPCCDLLLREDGSVVNRFKSGKQNNVLTLLCPNISGSHRIQLKVMATNLLGGEEQAFSIVYSLTQN